MQLQLIRNATMRIRFGGKTFLTDPMLSEKGVLKSFAGKEPNPILDLPVSGQAVAEGVDAVVVSHLHPDHFDRRAAELLPRDIPFYCQPGDEEILREFGFTSVTAIEKEASFFGVRLRRTKGKHGSGKILEYMGQVSGFVMEAEGEPLLYWIGDSILCDEVDDVLGRYRLEVIITHSGGAVKPGFEPIIMGDEETVAVARKMPDATVVAVHLESLDHCTVSRDVLRQAAESAGVASERLLIPADGETVIVQR